MNEKKYIFTEETKKVKGRILHRIQAVKDFGNVKAGDLGGWIEKEENLSHEGLAWVSREACVFGNARVFENARIYGNARMYGDAWVYGNARVYGKACTFGNARVYGDAQVYGNARVYENTQVSRNAQVFENAYVFGNALVGGEAWVYGCAQICGNAQVLDGEVCGNTEISQNAFIQSATDYLTIGPIGSRNDFTTFYKTEDKGIYVCCGCFNGPIEEFKAAIKETHGDDHYYAPYISIITCATHVLHLL